jgi:hypothetical protein
VPKHLNTESGACAEAIQERAEEIQQRAEEIQQRD